MVSYLCDEMLSKLARWLRMAGYDVISPRGLTDRELNQISVSEGRVLLTRDRDLSNMKGIESLLVRSDDLVTQLAEVFESYPVNDNPPGKSRCPVCNGELVSIRKSDLERKDEMNIPTKVMENQSLFLICSECSKIYWYGTHWEGITSILKEHGLMPEDFQIPP
ncbi:MAG: Mut7-C RNAse domain-containing protein [Thermoplasmatota archaeon]